MKSIFLLTLFIAFISYMPQKKKKVIFFGDSITQAGAQRGGYIQRIDSMCRLDGKSDQYEFVGAGISGNKVYDLYLRLQDDVLNHNPDIVVIYIGVNDVWHKAARGTGTDQSTFEQFYQAIIKKIKEKNSRIILATPAVIGEKSDNSNQLDGDLNQYSNIIRKIAKEHQLSVVDLRKGFIEYNKQNNPENKDQGILTSDRVHLNARGNQFVAEEMWKVIKTH